MRSFLTPHLDSLELPRELKNKASFVMCTTLALDTVPTDLLALPSSLHGYLPDTIVFSCKHCESSVPFLIHHCIISSENIQAVQYSSFNTFLFILNCEALGIITIMASTPHAIVWVFPKGLPWLKVWLPRWSYGEWGLVGGTRLLGSCPQKGLWDPCSLSDFLFGDINWYTHTSPSWCG